MGITLTQEGVMRVVVTIRKDTRPDWFHVLSKVSSGQARAELLRAHLSAPSESLIYEKRFLEPSPPNEVSEGAGEINSSFKSTGNPSTFETPESKPINSSFKSTGNPGTFEAPESKAVSSVLSGTATSIGVQTADSDEESLAEIMVRSTSRGF